MCHNIFFFENLTVFEITWKKYCTTGQATHDNTIWRKRIGSWIHKATNTHLSYIILIAFPLQQLLH